MSDLSDPAALLADLVRIPSVGGSPAESRIQHHLADWMETAGLEVDHWRIDLDGLASRPDFPGMEVPRTEAWGLVGRLPGSGGGPSLMFNGHVDVVPPGEPSAWAGDPFGGLLHGGRLYGRGACDMKGGLVAALTAVAGLRADRPRGDVLVACVVGEEDGGLGTYALLERGWRADACVIPEPTGLAVVPAAAGALTFRLRVPGLGAHAARRASGVSAVEKFWPVFAALRELEARRNAERDPLFARWDLAYPLEIGMVRAGDWASSVPGELVAEGRIGVALDEPPDRAQRALEEAVGRACAADPWLATHPVTVEWWGGRFAPARTTDATFLAAVADAVGDGAGRWAAPYGSDLRLLTAAGIPTVQYGPGDVDLAHAPGEHVSLAHVREAAHALTRLAVRHCA